MVVWFSYVAQSWPPSAGARTVDYYKMQINILCHLEALLTFRNFWNSHRKLYFKYVKRRQWCTMFHCIGRDFSNCVMERYVSEWVSERASNRWVRWERDGVSKLMSAASNCSQREREQPDLFADWCFQSLLLVTMRHALFHLTCNYFSH